MSAAEKKRKDKTRVRVEFSLPRFVLLPVCILPALLTLAFYIFRVNKPAVHWVEANISAPVRDFFGMLSSLYPFSLMEVLCVAAIVWLFYYLIRTVMVTVRRRSKLLILSKRFLTISVVLLYIWGLFCWLWNIGYHTTSFAEIYDLTSSGIATDELLAVTKLFAEKANEYAPLVARDEDGHFIGDRRRFVDESIDVFDNIFTMFPDLSGKLYKPKSMLFSSLMSRAGYTGVYFAITGESNINTKAPACYIPVTIAHELAHQRGVFAEDEANFVGIAACVASDNTVYEYSGWLLGLSYLRGALISVDSDAWTEIHANLSAYVLIDWQDNYEYWQSQKTVNTGIVFFDKILTALTEFFSDTVDNVYDNYLVSQNQELGIRSYGACVDLLVTHFMKEIGYQ